MEEEKNLQVRGATTRPGTLREPTRKAQGELWTSRLQLPSLAFRRHSAHKIIQQAVKAGASANVPKPFSTIPLIPCTIATRRSVHQDE